MSDIKTEEQNDKRKEDNANKSKIGMRYINPNLTSKRSIYERTTPFQSKYIKSDTSDDKGRNR